MFNAPSMTPDMILTVQLAAEDLKSAHEICSKIPPSERTSFENDIAQMGLNRLKRIAGSD